jgi:LacI family transcriptional regulator
MAVTVHDVAKKAGVAVGTVSRYLNGRQLREENRLKVEQAIKALGFKENVIAKSLKRNRSMTIAVMIPNYLTLFFMAVTKMLEQILEEYGYSLLLCDFDYDSRKLQEKLRFAKDRFVDGLIFFSSNLADENLLMLQEFLDDHIPIVLIEQSLPGLETDVIVVDNAHASFRAVEQLILHNHTRIAIVNGKEEVYVFRERFKGYKAAMQTYNLPVDEQWIVSEWFAEAGEYTAIKNLFASSTPPTAIYATHFHATIGTVMALHKLHLRIPEDVSLIGFDYFDLIDAIEPPLTMVEQPIDKIAQTTAELLLKRIGRDYTDFPQTITLDTKMLVRDSTRKI